MDESVQEPIVDVKQEQDQNPIPTEALQIAEAYSYLLSRFPLSTVLELMPHVRELMVANTYSH